MKFKSIHKFNPVNPVIGDSVRVSLPGAEKTYYGIIYIIFICILLYIYLLFVNINSIVHPIDQGWPKSQSRSTGINT
ncbi:hypothetical protein FWK35_00019963 [Aphis craccivora]|uniref:Uncharacterized protein n=1 Tax=Aphis craccivora TaxID=307492 RepID=A0A6G0ZJQ1_APHCR|nr:hypothetical protein FWK35_00019963 [Aphis craccivora]